MQHIEPVASESLISINSEERFVLLGLLHAETVGAVHAVVTAPHLTALQKTTNIIDELDFCFQLRSKLWDCLPTREEALLVGYDLVLSRVPPSTGELLLTDTQRLVLGKLIETANEDNLATDVVCALRHCRRQLVLKLSGDVGLMASMEAASPGATKFS